MMKRIILMIAAAALVYIPNSIAQDFKELLSKNFNAFESTHELPQKMEYSNKIGLISKKWTNEWAAHYYNAYSKAALSYQETDEAKRDAYLDEAERELEEAVALLKKDNDETYVLAAMLANARMAVKPQARWQKYGKIFEENLSKAKELNANNPRRYHLQGLSKYHTPKMFGGGKKAALPYLEKADGLFAKEGTDDITRPYWGKRTNDYFLQLAKGEDKE